MLSDLKPGFLRFPGMYVMIQSLVMSISELWHAHGKPRVTYRHVQGGVMWRAHG